MVYATRGSDGTGRYVTEFLIKRFSKIWIPYAGVGLLYFFVTRGSSALTIPSVLWAVKSLLFIPPDVTAPFYMGSGLTPVAWSLNYEFYFYLVFAASMLFRRLRWVFLALWMFAFIYALPVHDRGFFSVLPFSRINSTHAYLQMMTNPIVLEFLAGVAVGLIYLSPLRIKSEDACRIILFYVVALCCWAWLTHFRAVNSITYFGAFAVAAMLSFSIASKTLALQPPAVLMWLGNISYSLYLVHGLVNYALERYMDSIGQEALTKTWGHVVLTTATSLLVAMLSHAVLEKFAHDAVRDKLLSVFRHVSRQRITRPAGSATPDSTM